MAFWILDQWDDGPLDYPTLGFVADPDDILEAAAAPDGRWSSTGAGPETVTRYTLGVDPSYVEPGDGHVLTWSDVDNTYVPTAADVFLGEGLDAVTANLLANPTSDTFAASDAATATQIGDPGSEVATALDGKLADDVADLDAPVRVALDSAFARHRADRAPRIEAPLLVSTPITVTVNTKAVLGYDSAAGLYYGTDTTNGHYITSPDGVTWTDRTYSPSTYTPLLIAWEFDATYMYAYSSNGKVWRAPKGTFNSWTEITVPGLHAVTSGRPGSLLALGSGVLIYGNYTAGHGDGAHLWRSTNAGASWTMVLDTDDKHIHCVRRSPTTGWLWASIGDGGDPTIGLYRSKDDGLTWEYVSSNEYGIDMVFVPAQGERPDLVVLEGDGFNRPHLVAFPEDGEAGDNTFPLVWFTGPADNILSTRGTTRGIELTPDGDIIYFTTIEGGGVVGTRAGLWIAQGPDFTRSVLLKETTGAEPVAYSRTFVAGSTVFNYLWSFALPTFGSY